jgi:hypothetical protein
MSKLLAAGAQAVPPGGICGVFSATNPRFFLSIWWRPENLPVKAALSKNVANAMKNLIQTNKMKLIKYSLMAGSLALILVGCASAPKYNEEVNQFPQLSPGNGRIYFYRDSGFYGAGKQPYIRLNDEIVGNSITGHFFYVDRPAGNYVVDCRTGLYAEHKLAVALNAGETQYVRSKAEFDLLGGQMTLMKEGKDTAMKTLSQCVYSPNPVSPSGL